MPMHWMGSSGMPRRIFDYPDALQNWNVISTAGAYTSAFAFGLFIYIFCNTLRYGIIATIPNYWRIGQPVLFKFTIKQLIAYDNKYYYYGLLQVLRSYIDRYDFSLKFCIRSLHTYILDNYSIDYVFLNSVIVSFCKEVVQNAWSLVDAKNFFYFAISDFNICSLGLQTIFSFKNLDTSEIATNFKLVKLGYRCYYPMRWQMNFQCPATPIMEGIIDLHHDIFSILIIIFGTVIYTLGYFMYHFNQKRTKRLYNITHNTFWEVVWTSVPICILILILIPSYSLLYSMDAFSWNPSVLVKIVSHQWYWTYNVSCYNFLDITFDSCMKPFEELEEGELRLLEVDEELFYLWIPKLVL